MFPPDLDAGQEYLESMKHGHAGVRLFYFQPVHEIENVVAETDENALGLLCLVELNSG